MTYNNNSLVTVNKKNPVFVEKYIRELISLDYETGYVALKCKFIFCRRVNCLGCVSIVDSSGNLLFTSYSKPLANITNYATRITGLSHHEIDNAPPFHEVRKKVIAILKGKVVIGHNIYIDFKVLEIEHPMHKTMDTQIVPWIRRRAAQVGEFGTSLKRFSKALLGADSYPGYNSVTMDAVNTMSLFNLVKDDWFSFISKRLQEIEEVYNQEDEEQELLLELIVNRRRSVNRIVYSYRN